MHILVACTLLLTGCSETSDGNVKTRDSEQVQKATEKASSKILAIFNLKGKVTEPGALVAPCSEDSPEGKTYRASHPWSVYGVPFEEMAKAMHRLRTELPKSGWTIVKDGPDNSKAKAPQIVADSKDGEFSADIRLLDSREDPKHESLIEVTVESACYRSE